MYINRINNLVSNIMQIFFYFFSKFIYATFWVLVDYLFKKEV